MTNVCRIPQRVPTFAAMWEDIGRPHYLDLAHRLGVNPSTVRRWIKAGDAPRPVLLALYWLTRWGATDLDAELFNRAQVLQGLADSQARELMRARASLLALESALAVPSRGAALGLAHGRVLSLVYSNARTLADGQPLNERFQARDSSLIDDGPCQQGQRPGLVDEGPNVHYLRSGKPAPSAAASRPSTVP